MYIPQTRSTCAAKPLQCAAAVVQVAHVDGAATAAAVDVFFDDTISRVGIKMIFIGELQRFGGVRPLHVRIIVHVE